MTSRAQPPTSAGHRPQLMTTGAARAPTVTAAVQYRVSTTPTAIAPGEPERKPRFTPSLTSSTAMAPSGTAMPSPASRPAASAVRAFMRTPWHLPAPAAAIPRLPDSWRHRLPWLDVDAEGGVPWNRLPERGPSPCRGAAYDAFMGRYSLPLAGKFADFAGVIDGSTGARRRVRTGRAHRRTREAARRRAGCGLRPIGAVRRRVRGAQSRRGRASGFGRDGAVRRRVVRHRDVPTGAALRVRSRRGRNRDGAGGEPRGHRCRLRLELRPRRCRCCGPSGTRR